MIFQRPSIESCAAPGVILFALKPFLNQIVVFCCSIASVDFSNMVGGYFKRSLHQKHSRSSITLCGLLCTYHIFWGSKVSILTYLYDQSYSNELWPINNLTPRTFVLCASSPVQQQWELLSSPKRFGPKIHRRIFLSNTPSASASYADIVQALDPYRITGSIRVL